MLKQLICITLTLYVMSSELQLGVPALLSQIREIKTENEQGQEFMSLLDLELSQGSKVDEVVTMIGELLQQLKNDQQMENIEHAQSMTGFNLDVAQLEVNLGNLNAERQSTNQFIADTTNEVNALTQTVANLQAQLALLNGREEDIRAIRDKELLSYRARSQNNNRVLEALGQILPRLTTAVFQEQDKQAVLLETDREEIVNQIRRELGYSSPLAILVSMTSTFDIGTVTRIIEKLEQVRDGVKQSQVEEDARETNAIQLMQTLISELNDVRDRLAADYTTSIALLKRKNNDKVVAERNLTILVTDINTTQELLVNTRNQRESYDSNFQSRSNRRSGEIKTVEQAYLLVSQSADSIKAKAKL